MFYRLLMSYSPRRDGPVAPLILQGSKRAQFWPRFWPVIFKRAGFETKQYDGNLNKTLSYRRNSAHRRSLRSSRLFKVTGVSSNRKPVYATS